MSNENKVSFEILEPKGKLKDPKREGLKNPRLTDLNGKTIAFMTIHVGDLFQFGSELFFDLLEEAFLKRYPGVKFYRCKSFGSPNAVVNADEIAEHCDAWVEGVKEAITQGKRDVGVFMEHAGRPGVSICSDILYRSKSALQDLNGMPRVRLVTVPETDYCVAKRDPELMRPVVEAACDKIIAALLTPLTEEEKEDFVLEYDYSPKTFSGETYHEAYEKFLQYCADNALSDGLPVVPPTKENVEWMLTGTTYPRDKEIGLVFPKRGIATVEKIAIAAVMAGCKPEYLPVLIGIMDAFTDPNFNQFHVVNEILPTIFLSGPIVKELGYNTHCGYLAPGYRINATIGRAVLMCMITIGWRDMTIYASPGGPGQPAAYANYIIPENQDESPWDSWAEQNGYTNGESVVTICENTGVMRGPGECMSNSSCEERIAQISNLFSRKGPLFSAFGMAENGENSRHMIVLHPAMAKQLALKGFTKESFVEYLYKQNVIDYDSMTEEEREHLREQLRLERAAANDKMYFLLPEDIKPGLHREPFHELSDVLIMVAGSGAGNSMIFQTVCGSSAPNAEDVKEPRPWMTKVIRGAALTEAGR